MAKTGAKLAATQTLKWLECPLSEGPSRAENDHKGSKVATSPDLAPCLLFTNSTSKRTFRFRPVSAKTLSSSANR